MIPMTPIGTRTLRMTRPFGRVHSSMTLPMGSGRSATWSRPSAMPAMRASLSISLSSRDSGMPLSRPFCISFSFAARISGVLLSSAPAISRRALFFCSVVS